MATDRQLSSQVRQLEELNAPVWSLRATCKTPKGRFTEEAKKVIRSMSEAGMTGSDIAKLMDVTPPAISKILSSEADD